MLVGLIGVVAPILPGVPLAWLGFFIYAIGTGFDRISLTTTIVFSVLTAIIIVLDLLGSRYISADSVITFSFFS